jgi:hypothetical protein
LPSIQGFPLRFSETKHGNSQQLASALFSVASTRQSLAIVGVRKRREGKLLPQVGPSVKAEITRSPQRREGGELMARVSVADRSAAHQNYLP